MITRGNVVRSSLLIALLALILPAAASAQATRTWVSGVGDDANPCSRTAPCKTFAGAISKTATAGEINCLDPGGFGAVTITKAIAIKCHNTLGGVLNAGTNGVVISSATPASAKITLRGLDIDGAGTGVNGIRIDGGGAVKIYDSEIFGQAQSGILYDAATGGSPRLTVARTDIHDNGGDGVLVAPAAGATNVRARVSESDIDDNACGVVATSRLSTTSNFGTNCGTGTSTGGVVNLNVFDTEIHDHFLGSGTGVMANGSSALIRIGGNAITNNLAGLVALNAAAIVSFGDNYVSGNFNGGVTDGAPTSTVPRS